MRSFRNSGLALTALAILLLPLFGFSGSLSLAQNIVSSGLIVPLQMNTPLSSRTAHVGDRWSATVSQDVYDRGALVIPRGSTVEGIVTTADDADRFNESGKIGIDFRTITLPNGEQIDNIDAMLTSLDPSLRNQIDDENRIRGNSSTFKRNIYFIGGGTGAGALIGAIAGGGSGAGIGAGVGAATGLILGALNKGRDVEIAAGTEFGMQVLSPLSVRGFESNTAQNRDRYRDNQYSQNNTYINRTYNLTRTDIISLQRSLRAQGYYRGAISGSFTANTRQALIDYQDDHDLAATGRVDRVTAKALGLNLNASDLNDVENIDPNGQPTYMGVGSTHRFIIWRNGNRWFLRTTTAGQEHNFEGTITASDGTIRSITRANLEANDFDRLSLDRNRRTLNFDFTTAGHMDGFTFYSDADTLTFNLRMDNREVPQHVYIGRDGSNPVSVPFTLVNE